MICGIYSERYVLFSNVYLPTRVRLKRRTENMWKENGPKVRNGFREVLILVTEGKKEKTGYQLIIEF